MDKKKLRYYYWFFLEFAKKNARAVVLSFVCALLLGIVSVILAPYFGLVFTSNKRTIGYAQQYTLSNLPDEIRSLISKPLVITRADGSVSPYLAEKIIPGENGLYTIELNKNLLWSDGKAVTSADIKKAIEDEFKKRNTNVLIEVQNSTTLTITLATEAKNEKPLAILPTYLTFPIIKNKYIGIAGDYTISHISYNNGYISTLILNPTSSENPYLIYKFYQNDTLVIQAYKHGDITEFEAIKSETVEEFKDWSNTEIKEKVDYSKLLTLFYNINNKYLKEEQQEIKRALSLAIPQVNFKESGELAKSPIAPNSWAFNNELKPKVQDLDRAKKILEPYATAGASLAFYTYNTYIKEADVIASAIKETGFNVNVEYIGYELPKDYDLLLASFTIPKDPDQYLLWHSTQTSNANITGYNNPRIDLLLEEARSTADTEERKAFYLKFQDIFMSNPPAYFLYYPYVYTIKRK
jgi:ABC-type transport system substrate-binding protein